MKDGVLLGMAVGAIIGAYVVTTNSKAEDFVIKGKNTLKKQIDKL